MSLSAWEQQALNSIKDGLAGSDPDLAALLSAFTRLASGDEMPDGEKIRSGSRRAWRRLRRARGRPTVRKICQRLGIQQALLLLWLLTTAAMIAVALALNAGGSHRTCTETAVMTCISPAPGHSPGSPSDKATTGRAPAKPVVPAQHANPLVPPG